MEASRQARGGKAVAILIWVATAFVGLGIGASGLGKLVPSSSWVAYFVNWGYPAVFTRVVGVAEVAGGITLLFPRSAFYGAVWLGIIMCSAATTLATHRGVPPGWPPTAPSVYAAILSLIAVYRWSDKVPMRAALGRSAPTPR